MPLSSAICVSGKPPLARFDDIFCALSQIDLACVIPTLLSGTVGVTGDVITLVFDEEVTGTGAGFELLMDSNNATLTYVSGNGTNMLVFSMSVVAIESESINLTYDAVAGDVASGDCPLASIEGVEVTNNTGLTFEYLRPGGVDGYFRPGGVDTYLRP